MLCKKCPCRSSTQQIRSEIDECYRTHLLTAKSQVLGTFGNRVVGGQTKYRVPRDLTTSATRASPLRAPIHGLDDLENMEE